MKHRLKGLLALVLSLTMVLSMVTVSTASQSSGSGSAPTTYPVKIGGVEFASNNLVIDSRDITGVTGTATYVPADGANPATLTLNDFILENYHYSAIYATENLTINLIGATNKVTSSSDGGYSGGMAIYVDGDLKITGDNNASLTAGGGGQSAGIVSTGNTDLAGGAVTVNGTTGSACIRNMNGKITISGGTVTVNGNSDRNSGIHAGGDITISGGTVNAEGINSNGIYSANGTVSITGGEVEATGRDSGINANNITITGGTVTAKATNVGIKATDSITIGGANNPTVEVGCATGLEANDVELNSNCTIILNSARNAVVGTLNLDTPYQWTNDSAATTLMSNTADPITDYYDGSTSMYPPYLKFIVGASTSGQGTATQQPPTYYPIYIPTVEDEPEVTTPKTFDGGIASAVVVTILSATGGAWLAKKKD